MHETSRCVDSQATGLFRRFVSNGVLFGAMLSVFMLGLDKPARAQGFGIPDPGGQYPSQAYYNALKLYRDGDLENAIEALEIAQRSTRTDVNGKWLDSIPVRAMLAECYWHLGHLPACRTHLDEATRIAIRNRGWLSQIDWSVLDQAAAIAAKPMTLWPEANAVRELPIPRRMPMYSGTALTEQRIAAGGVIEGPNVKNLDVIEILRGLAIVSHRRRVLLGPLGMQDALGAELLEATKLPATLNHPAAKTMLFATRAVEYFAVGNDKTTIDRARKYATVGPAVHPMTPLLLLSAISAGAGGDDRGVLTNDAIATLISTAQQLTNSAAAIEQYEWIGEGLQIAVGVASPQQLARVEQSAVLAARTLVRQSRLASLHCYLVAADAAISAGRVTAAQEHARAAIEIANRRDVQWPRLEAYGAYIAARLAAKQGQSIGMAGSNDMSTAMKAMSEFILQRRDRNRVVVSMPWNYQTSLVLASLGRGIGNQSAKQLVQAYSNGVDLPRLRRDPVDAMAAMYFNDTPMHVALLNLAAMESNGPEVLRQSDRLLAKRFTERLPLQGRLLQLRTIVSSEQAALWPSAKEFLARPNSELNAVRVEVQKSLEVPAAPQAADAGVGIAAALDAKVSVRSYQQALLFESKLSELALSRIQVPTMSPPRVSKTDAAQLPAGTALLTFAIESEKVFATLTREGKTRTWTIPAARRLPAMVNRLLQDIGASRGRGKRIHEGEKWRDAAAKLKNVLLPSSSGFTEAGLERLVIVPDGPLWYVPFELFPTENVAVGEAAQPDSTQPRPLWFDSLPIGYAPTPGFALRNVVTATSKQRLALIAGGFFAPRNLDLNKSMVDQILSPADEPASFTPANSPPTERIGLEIGHLVVAAPVSPNLDDPLSTQIVPVDNSVGRTSGAGNWDQLRDWVRLPAGGPQSVALAGYRTTASTTKLGDGGELFFPMVALRSAGVREVLLTRWATGGQSAATIVGELVNETPHTSLAAAARRGVSLLRQTELPILGEPLLGKADAESAPLTGDQPLFWSPYLTTDSFSLGPPDTED